MVFNNSFDGAVREYLILLADELDCLADLGITMSQTDVSRVAGRNEWISKHLANVTNTTLAISKILDCSDAEPVLKNKLRSILLSSSGSLTNSFAEMATHFAESAGKQYSSFLVVVLNWDRLRESIGEIALLLGIGAEAWLTQIIDRQPVYRDLLFQFQRYLEE